MAKTSIYLPDDLAEQVRAYSISISEVAQHALRRAVQEEQIKEKDMTDVHALAERLNLQRQKDAEAAYAKDATRRAKTRSYGTGWAQSVASAEEIEYVATYSGAAEDYRTPHSFLNYAESRNLREHRERAGSHGGLAMPSGVPMGPSDFYWADLQAAVGEVWEQVKPLIHRFDNFGEDNPADGGGYAALLNPAYRLWTLREPSPDASQAEHDAWFAEQPDEFL